MNVPLRRPVPDLPTLFAQFPPADDLPQYELIPPHQMPEPHRRLLVHEHHMTVTVEAYHGSLVDVRVLQVSHQGDSYARKIVLPLQSNSSTIALFGIIRINLSDCSPEVAARIVEGKTPLGRILIEHDVLRRIEPTAYFRVEPGPKQLAWFNLQKPVPLYGRLAIIHCDGRPAVELLEVVTA